MPVFCPNCGVMQPEGVARCANCGASIGAAPAAASPDKPAANEDAITGREMRAYALVAFRYTIVPILIALVVLCAAWIVCSQLIR